jgi:oligoendopeptidase F
MANSTILVARADVPMRYRWNSSSVFETPEDWEEEVSSVEKNLKDLTKYKGKLAENPEILLAWFEYTQDLLSKLGKLYVYANLSYSVDTLDQEAAARLSKLRSLQARVIGELSFGDPEILSIGRENLDAWIKSTPALSVYQHYFDKVFDIGPHLRNADIEEILGYISDPFRTTSSIHATLVDTDLDFEPARDDAGNSYEVGQSSIGGLLTRVDRNVRRTAWESYADGYLAVKNTLAGCLSAGVKQDVFNTRVRKYSTSLEASLDPNQIPTAVFHNLIDTFRRNLPVWHKYWRLRKRLLGLNRLHVYDIKAPLTNETVKLDFEQAVEYIFAGMQPLGEEYTSILRKGVLEQGWVDSYPNRGKRSGAFSSGSHGTHPFIVMSYNQDIYGLSTLAHELGHSMHSFYTRQNQPFVYGRYSLFVAEVASNFNQAMVRAHLLDQSGDKDFKVAVLEEAMSNFHRYFFIMPTLARFELEIHTRIEQGGALTADDLNTLMTNLFAEGYGDEVEIDHDRIGITWAQFPNHLYANFYVYQYATGISGAHSLASSVLAGHPGAVDRYLEFLKAGGSQYPLDALRSAGVDLTNPEPIEQTFQVLSDLVDLLADLTS